jgi:predicted permease
VIARSNSPETTLGGETPKVLVGSIVSCNYFDVLRQPPALGRALIAQDCEPGAAPVVILSHNLWRTTFAANPGIVGRTIELNRRSFTVVGVATEGMYGGPGYLGGGYLAPISTEPLLRRISRYADDRHRWLYLIGRRKDGAGVEQVRTELRVIAAQIDQQQPGRSTTLTVDREIPTTVSADQRPAALGRAAVLMAAFVFVLLIACANVANLLLARGTARSQEIGIRLSLGASRARVVRQLVTESMLISIAGGLIGSVLAMWSFQGLVARALPALMPPSFPLAFALNLSPDIRALAFAVALTFVTGILFGLVPALSVSKPDLHVVTRQDSAGAGSSKRGGRLRGVLVGVQVALCMTLMIAAGLLLRGLHATYTVDTGFEYRDVAYVSLESTFDVQGPEEGVEFRRRLMSEVAALPGVTAVAYTDRQPLGFDNARIRIRLPGESEETTRATELISVTPGYFSVLKLPIMRGRTFTDTEIRNPVPGVRPVIVSEATARNLWPGADPIGQTLLSSEPVMLAGETLQVVGVAADAQTNSLGGIDPYYVYLPGGGAALLVKSRVGFAATASSIRAIVAGLDPTLVVPVLPLEANLGYWRGLSRTIATLFAGLGVLALMLASVGIYSVVAYTVSRRYREIGIRMALGAEARNVLGMILRKTMRPVVIGAVIGFVAAAGLSRILSSVLFGVSPADPIGLGGATLLVLVVAGAAGVIAARPATQADPTIALRHE